MFGSTRSMRLMWQLALSVAIVLSVLVGGGASALATARTYAVADLGTLGGDSIATGINDRGDAVGCAAFTGATCDRAVIFADGQVLNLGTLPGGAFSVADAVNNRGQVVGTSAIPTSPSLPFGHAFLFSDGQMRDLGTLGGTWSQAFGVNASTSVVGGAYTAGDTTQHAFLYRDGHMTDINPPGSSLSVAFDINNSGTAVGLAISATCDCGFMWRDGSVVTLGTLGGAGSEATAINTAGDVVGDANTSTGTVHAFLYREGQMLDLGSLGGSQGMSEAQAINDAGDVVGVSAMGPSLGFPLHAFLWNGSTMLDLNDLVNDSSGWELESAYGINNRGEITGIGIHNGEVRPFLLTPKGVGG